MLIAVIAETKRIRSADSAEQELYLRRPTLLATATYTMEIVI